MGQKYGVVVANVTEDTQEFWNGFKRAVKAKGLSYTSGLEQAAHLWLARERGQVTQTNPFQQLPFVDPAPVGDNIDD